MGEQEEVKRFRPFIALALLISCTWERTPAGSQNSQKVLNTRSDMRSLCRGIIALAVDPYIKARLTRPLVEEHADRI